jgi:two-component system, NtrC family, response regulator PilR
MKPSAQKRSGSRAPHIPVVPKILVVDDEPDLRELVELTLVRMGLAVESAASVAEAKAKLDANTYDLCLTDMRLGDGLGLDVVRHIQQSDKDVPVAVITAHGSADNAVEALKAGAFDYLAKPVGIDALRGLVRSALDLDAPAKSASGVEASSSVGSAGSVGSVGAATSVGLVGESAALEEVRMLIAKVGKNMAPVHIHGESGSGKEVAARSIHASGNRANKPFVAVNCGAIPETLMESEFFGYRKGAFTGAEADRDGFFQAAHGGTLFLDEVADLPLAMQVKLLRAIQEKRVRKVGATTEEPVDVRIISATHQDLAANVEAGKFRQDLMYRLNVIDLHMPPLRECRDDVPVLAAHVLGRLARNQYAPVQRLSAAAAKALAGYDFPGNVRELENLLERAMALSSGEVIDVEDLRLSATPGDDTHAKPLPADAGIDAWMQKPIKAPLQDYLDAVEKAAIMEALDKTRFNRTKAAQLLGVTFRSLRYRLQRLGIE